MKTQVLLRLILIAVALFVTINTNNGSIMQTIHISANYNNNKASEKAAKEEGKTAHSNDLNKQNSLPYLPQADNHNDYECFDFKHHQKRNFWKCIANRFFAFFYHAVILIPIAIEIIEQLFHS